MGTSAKKKKLQDVAIPKRVKISSKNQITIPTDIYRRKRFGEYALITETEDGFTVQPLTLVEDDEELTLKLLKYLIDKGCEGDELIQQFEELKPKFVGYFKATGHADVDFFGIDLPDSQ